MDISTLQNIPLFAGLNREALEDLSHHLRKETYAANHTIFWMDERGEHLYIILSGKVRISYIDDEAHEITLATLSTGSFFGELSVIDGGPHTATARSINETILLILDSTSFYNFLDKHPQLGYNLLKVLSLRLRSNTARIHKVVNVNDELEAKRSRFQRFIDKLAQSLTSSTFVTFYIVFIIGWIGLQVYLHKQHHLGPISFMDSPPTFFILGFLITLTSFLLTILILNSQRRQAENDRIRGEIEYHINLK
jgi:CRP/FNR family cyclic AMP-dependent transcriptional regulator